MKGGTHCRRSDGVGADVEPPPLGGSAAGQPDNRRLCRVVVAVQPGTDFDIDRVEVDDLATAPRLHVRQRGFHRPPGSPHGRAEGLLQHRIGFFFQEHIGGGRKGVVDQDVQPPELIHGQLHGGLDVRFAAHVSLDEYSLAT
ncbi:hypothetical protein D3C73_1220550 [compost metagenome]